MRIGEVAKLLDISVETIRYYESEGIVSPSRKEGSKYREYETWDIFYLMECMAFRNMGLSVKDIAAALHREPLSFMLEKVAEQQRFLEKEIRQKSMLLQYLRQYSQMLEMLPMNLGNYWMVKRPAYAVLEYTISEDDDYAPIQVNQELFKAWMSKGPFMRSAQFIDMDAKGNLMQGAWAMIADEQTMHELDVPRGEAVYDLPEKICLMTVIDGGERGDLTDDKFETVFDEISRRGYTIDGRIMAFLINRHWENGTYHRYIEVTIPVKK